MITEAIIASVMAGTTACSDHFENVSRFNPTDLSDYQMCVHTVHGHEAGTVGKHLWVQIDGQFFTVGLDELKGKNQNDMLDVVNKSIAEQVLEAEIETLEAQIETQEAAIELLKAAGVTSAATIKTLNATIATQKTTIGTLQGVVDSLNDLSYFAYIDVAAAAADADAQHNDAVPTITGTTSQAMTGSGDWRGHGTLTVRGKTISLDGAGFNIYVGDRNITSQIRPNELTRFTVSDLETVVQRAYDQGYNDGYSAGYTAGYAHGFADGRNAK